MKFNRTKPCDNCPFRSDVKPYIRPERAEQITASLERGSFPCHKTTEFDDEGDHVPRDKEQHCAGALIMLEKIDQPSQMMRIMERLGMYDRTKLDMDSPVYDSPDEFIDAHYEAET